MRFHQDLDLEMDNLLSIFFIGAEIVKGFRLCQSLASKSYLSHFNSLMASVYYIL